MCGWRWALRSWPVERRGSSPSSSSWSSSAVWPGRLTWEALGLMGNRVVRGVGFGVLGAAGMLVVTVGANSVLQAFGIPNPQVDELRWLRDVPLAQYGMVAVLGAAFAPAVE